MRELLSDNRPRVVIIGGGFGGLYAARGLAGGSPSVSLRRLCSSLPMIPSGSPKKRFSFRAAYVRCYRQTVQQQERETKHENKIVRRRACCERGHDCSSEPGRCSRSERGISQRRGCTQCPGCSRSDAARRCFIVPLDADAVTRQ
jgi:hypothetical protein